VGKSARVVVTEPGDGRLIALGPAENVVKVDRTDSDGRMGVIEMTLQRFESPPPHFHKEVDHLWYILEGRVEANINSREVTLVEGTVAFVPRGASHAFWNPDQKPCRMLEVDTPRTLEGYYEELSAAFPPGAKLDPAVASEIQRRHDTLIQAPVQPSDGFDGGASVSAPT
jgi:mannose-6-phosphate isomerase-like protein (cupin superfamily)